MTKSSAKNPKPAEYNVGYGKPPKAGQFEKGKSGNPSGRPRKAAAFRMDLVVDAYVGDIILREAARLVPVKDNGQTGEISTIEAIVRAQNVAAIKGDHKAQMAAITQVKQAQDRTLDGRRTTYNTALDYKERCRQEFMECDRNGEPRPVLLPHHEDILVDHRTLEVRITGPSTPEELVVWEERQAYADELKRQRDQLAADLAVDPDRRAGIENQLRQLDAVIRATALAYPDERTRRQPGFDLEASRRAIPAKLPINLIRR